jgi:predicted acyl esterase
MKSEQTAANLDCPVALEKDVDVPMRDGARLKADVFRPDGDG